MFERIPYLLTTSSIMGSGLAASNWSFTLSSTVNKNIHHLQVFIEAKHRQCRTINTVVSNYPMRVGHWAPSSASALHPQECNSLVSILWWHKIQIWSTESCERSTILSCSFVIIQEVALSPCVLKHTSKKKKKKRPSANPRQLHT